MQGWEWYVPAMPGGPGREAAAALSLSHRNAVSVSNLFMNDLSSHRVRYLLAPHAAHSDDVGFFVGFCFPFFHSLVLLFGKMTRRLVGPYFMTSTSERVLPGNQREDEMRYPEHVSTRPADFYLFLDNESTSNE